MTDGVRSKERIRKTEWARQKYKEDPELACAKVRDWSAKHRERLAAKSRAYHAANREKALASQKRWRAANVGRERDRSKAYHKAHPRVHRKASLKRRYGMTLAQWEAMFATQGQRCACCGGSEPNDRQWHTDHDHDTGVVRGILCRPCNLMLIRQADMERLQQGIAYLQLAQLLA